MRVALVSDSHSNVVTLGEAAERLRALAPDVVLHCGDICDPEVVPVLAGLPVRWVLGNCDWREADLRAAIERVGHVFCGAWGEIATPSGALAFLHGHDGKRLRTLVESGDYRYVVHGHTHRARDDEIDGTRVINPGALHRASEHTFALLDAAGDELTFVELDG